MKTLRKQDKQNKFDGDVYRMTHEAIKCELGYAKLEKYALEYEIYSTPNGDMKISINKIQNADFIVKCIEANETTLMYCKFI